MALLSTFALGAALLTNVSPQTQAQAPAPATIDPQAVVVTINGEEVRAQEYYRRMEYLDLRLPAARLRDRLLNYPPGFIALDQIITERLLLQLAKEKGVSPTNPEVQEELNAQLEQNPKILENWQRSGRTRAEFEYQIRYELAQFKLSTFGITVTDQELDRFYRENPTFFTSPKQYRLRVIAVTDAAKRAAVDADLQGGMKFADAARKHSDDVSRLSGGEFGLFSRDQLPEVMRGPVELIKIGQTTPWLEVSGQNVKLFLEDVVASRVQPLDAPTRRALRQRLMVDRGRARNDVNRQVLEARLKAKVVISKPEFQLLYDRLMQDLRQARGASAPN